MKKSLLVITTLILIASALSWAASQGSLTVSGVSLFALCAAVPFVLHWLMFVPAYVFQTEHYFDLTGSLSFLTAVAVALLLNPAPTPRAWILGAMISIWAIRLGSFLFFRIKKAGKDNRFTVMKTIFWRFLITWTLGGFWVLGTIAAGLAAMTSSNSVAFDWLSYLGVGVWILGFSIEVIADRQKTNFRASAENADRFISEGLWSRSRHPNYFGEIVIWLGIAIIALPVLSGWQYATLISPVFVALLLIKVSGVKLLEEIAEKRWGSDPDYKRYRDSTPVLIPKLF